MKPFLRIGLGPAGPLLFLLAIGGAIALAEYWLRSQLPQRTAFDRGRAIPPKCVE